MRLDAFPISSVFRIVPRRIGDERGYFCETFQQAWFSQNVGPFAFVQDNESLSAEIGTIRGLHFQLSPRAQGKLVRCVAGAIMDVAVDIRRGSPTFGQSVSAELTAENGHQLWIPPGFAHGFCTLAVNSVIAYKVTDYYSPDHDRGLMWNDPALKIDWPVAATEAIVSSKDKLQPRLADLVTTFVYEAGEA